ncbi:MAG: ATP-dependent Clp protease ATP-binding subunit [Planctomycetes bacterium]|nr:ATP-dependent Clp protease ATP-binding subunit [Planctomycetota bacterium]
MENHPHGSTTAAIPPNGEATREPFGLPPELAPSEDLTQKASAAGDGRPSPFDAVPAYQKVFEEVARILHRRRAHHVLLVGERGVAKTTVLAELARRAAAGEISPLAGSRFLYVDCRYFAPEEGRERLAVLLALLAGQRDLVACLDGLGALLEAGGPRGSRATLLAALSAATCRLIALLTPREYEEAFADDPDFTDHFQRVEVPEPDPEAALALLRHFAAGLEQQFAVAIDEEAIRQAVLLSAGYIFNDHLPAKALRLLHRACEDIDFERCRHGSSRRRVTADDMVRAVAEASGVPAETLCGIAGRSDYEQSLGEMVVGQDQAVRAVAAELGLIKAGMTDPDKPASVLLFLGQTGTGKTEMAKALARLYSTSKRLKTYTLGNCVEPHSVATIIGVPPGYVGNDQGGRLVNELNADPYCVFLLDEADKAHPDVLQPFLNLFDEGWVTDQRGTKAYADKSIFILTSNVGQRMIADLRRQGKSMDEITERMKEALAQIRHTKSNRPVFSPEFLARIKRIIVFNPLDRAAMHGIARKLVAGLVQSWADKRGKDLVVPQDLLDHIADKAHDQNEKSQGREGGRVVRKLIADLIEIPVQRAISQDPAGYRACSAVAVDFGPPEPGSADPKITIRFRPAQEDPR